MWFLPWSPFIIRKPYLLIVFNSVSLTIWFTYWRRTWKLVMGIYWRRRLPPKSWSAISKDGETKEERGKWRMNKKRNYEKDSIPGKGKIKGTSFPHILYLIWLIKVCKDVFRNADLSRRFCLASHCFFRILHNWLTFLLHKITCRDTSQKFFSRSLESIF